MVLLDKIKDNKYKLKMFDYYQDEYYKLKNQLNDQTDEYTKIISNNDFYINKIKELISNKTYEIFDIKYTDGLIKYIVIGFWNESSFDGKKTLDLYLIRKEDSNLHTRMFLHENEPKKLYIDDFISEHQNQGYGKALNEVMEKVIKRKGYTGVYGHLGTYDDEREYKVGIKDKLKIIYEHLGYDVIMNTEKGIYRIHKSII